MKRREFILKASAGLSACQLRAPLAFDAGLVQNPFTLGIASGDVTQDSVVLWTRLAPQPLAADGGMAPVNIPVQWALADDAKMTRIIQRGEVAAGPALAHSVHVEVQGLKPAHEYWYRFMAGGHASKIGRTRTLPAAAAGLTALRFVTASCQNYTHGYFVAYKHMLEDKPDFVIHLGDYIYDTAFGESFREHETVEALATLAAFRRRHARYKTDKHLQQAHAQLPFFTMVDNHDAIEDRDAAKFQKRAAAYQAWYEHMPVRGYGGAGRNHFELKRRLVLGDLVQLSLLDARQFRDKKDLCRADMDPDYGFGAYRQRCRELFAEKRSMLGREQAQWLRDNLVQNRARWNVLASPGPFLPFRFYQGDKELAYIGAWEAYPAERRRIVQALGQARFGHPLILSGDLHSFWALDGALARPSVGPIPVVEFVSSSISANWPAPLAQPVTDNLPRNPQVQFYEPDRRGYLLHEVNAVAWQTTMRALEDVREIDSGAFDLARFLLENGRPGLTRID